MAYFQQQQQQDDSYEEYEDYDDGFDELNAENPEDYGEETEEELEEEKKSRARLLYGFGNLGGVIIGTGVILLLITLLLSMINFIQTDINRNFSLLQTRF